MNPVRGTRVRALLLGLVLAAIGTASGCQVSIGGQTLPSGYYMADDVQYFPSGPEFILSREAAAMEQYAREQQPPGQ